MLKPYDSYLEKVKHVTTMGFYDLSKEERLEKVAEIKATVERDLETGTTYTIRDYASDRDTYIRKNCYLALGRLYHEQESLRENVLNTLENLLEDENELVRQTGVYSLGEIGKRDAGAVMMLFGRMLEDPHHKVRNAVIGSLKQMGQKNPGPVLAFARKHIHHPDPEVRREVVHGVELRGRTHPEDVLPLLEELQHEEERRVRDMIVHVLAQVSYKKGCLKKVVPVLMTWENKELVECALKEILDVHRNYARFCAVSPEEAEEYIRREFGF